MYNFKKENIRKKYFFNTSKRLFNSAWKQYIVYLRGSIDNPIDDNDIVNWIEQIISEKVNNPKSSFYIYGF